MEYKHLGGVISTPCTRKRTKSEISTTPSPVLQPPKQIRMSSLEMASPVGTVKSALPTEWHTLSQDEKLDKLMEKLMTIDDISRKVNTIIEEREGQIGTDLLLLKISTLEGKNLKLENEVERLSQKVEDLQWRDMRENLVFYSIPESNGEDCENVITKFLVDEMKINPEDIYSHGNLIGEVRIDVAHRVGKKSAASVRDRPIVAKFLTRKGKDYVLKHAQNLAGKRYGVSEQLPPEMRERKLAQMGQMKELRKQNIGKSSQKIHFVKDKLMHNGKVIPSNFEQNKLPSLKSIPQDYNALFHSEPVTVEGSTFQGHAMTVHSVEDAVRARDALFQDPAVASADHLMYAYHIDVGEGIFESGNSDDREYKGSDVLVKFIQNQDIENIFVAVSRIHSGPNLGGRRFQLIKQACADVLMLM